MDKIFISDKELSEIMDISLGHAYKLIKQMNNELKQSGYLVVAGKVPIAFFKKKFFGGVE